MSPAIGSQVNADKASDVLVRSRARAALIPDLLVEAQRVANNVFAGWHGRRRRGIGENFWQFRPYVEGENYAAIDWRKSARDDIVYVRDREWQASHTVWLWVDESPSMLFKSGEAAVSKQSRALVLGLAMAELLARSGERIGWLGVTPPIVHRHAAERLAAALMVSKTQSKFPDTSLISDHSEVILISDFLGADGQEHALDPAFQAVAEKHVRGHLVQIIDPAEEVFPYFGRVEFRDPETKNQISFGSAQSIRADYQALFAAHCTELSEFAKRTEWSHTLHHTDQLASKALQSLHVNLSASPMRGVR
jgi:uncharacterized protein (DUF58 family)